MEKIIFSAGQKKIYEEGEPPVRETMINER